VGGRYQITHVYFSGQGTLMSRGADELGASSEADVDSDSFRTLPAVFSAGLSFFSPGVDGVPPPKVAVLKSNAVPGVLGVLPAEPNDAKAPEPSPNADEPVVGEASPGPVMGERAVKGFRPPCEDVSPPKRFEAEKVR